jgi:hypothetical protein
VKCDETKPHCQKCSRFGRKCGGYLSPTRQKPKVVIPGIRTHTHTPDSQATSLPDLLRQPVEAIPLSNDLEARYFRIFQEQTAPELAGAFHLSLWDGLVLQASRNEPFARHAVVALGALNMSYKAQLYETNSVLPLHSPPPEEHHRFALLQYDKAVMYMRSTIFDIDRDLWKALLSCLFVYCFESFQGRKDLAMAHAQSGQKLLQDRITSRMVRKEKSCILDIDIIQAFARLDLLLMTAYDTRTRASHSSFSYTKCTLLSEMPSTFKTIATAKAYLELLMRKIGHFLASALGFRDCRDPNWLGMEVPDEPQETQTDLQFGLSIYCYQGTVVPPAYRLQHAERTADLRRWCAAFEPLAREAQAAGEDSDIWLAMARLQIHSRIMKILLAGGLFTSEICYDDYLPDFKAIVSYALHILENEAKMKQASFNFDLSIIQPVGFVGLCCRDWKVRREALRILKMETLKKEVFWERGMLEAQARFVMETEEERLRFGELIPEENRARLFSVSKDEVRRCASVKILLNKGGKRVVRAKLIKW